MEFYWREILLCVGITIFCLGISCLGYWLIAKKNNAQLNAKFSKYFLLVMWIIFVLEEIMKYSVEAFVFHTNEIWLYVPIHLCSLPMFFIPLLMFKNKWQKEIYNVLFVSLFIVLLTFIIGQDTDTPIDVVGAEQTTSSLFYFYHTILWHTLLVLLFFHLVLFKREMYTGFKTNLYSSLVLLAVNFVIFFFASIYTEAGFSHPYFVLYNKQFEPFYSITGENEVLTNFILFIIISALCEIVYVGCYYLNRACKNLKFAKTEFPQ